MARMRDWFQNRVWGRTIVRNILVLMTGTAVSQAVAMIVAIFTARLFTPEAFGQFALYGSITAVLAAIASLRFDMTIVLPESDEEARVIGRLATRANIVCAALASLLAFLLRDVVEQIWGDATLATWLPVAGISIFLIAQVTILQYWYNRQGDYKTISVNRVEQTVGSSGGQLFFGLIGQQTMPGLLFGTMFGQLFAYVNLNRKAKDFRRPLGPDAPRMRDVARTYKKMPLLNLPNTLIDSLRTNGIVLLIGTVAVGVVGQFNLAWRILQVPIGLINGAVAQVFYKELARIKPGRMSRLVRQTIVRAFLLSIVPFGAIYILAPWLFTFVFGHQWDLAGDIARALTPWLAMQLITSPISTVFVVTSKQHWMLVFSIFFCAAPLAWLYWSPMELLDTLTVLGFLMAGFLAVMLLMADTVARQFDKTPDQPDQPDDMSGPTLG